MLTNMTFRMLVIIVLLAVALPLTAAAKDYDELVPADSTDLPQVDATYGSEAGGSTGDVGIQSHGSICHCTIHASDPTRSGNYIYGDGWQTCSPATTQRIVHVCIDVYHTYLFYWENLGCSGPTGYTYSDFLAYPGNYWVTCKSGTWTYRTRVKGEYWDPVKARFYQGEVQSGYYLRTSC